MSKKLNTLEYWIEKHGDRGEELINLKKNNLHQEEVKKIQHLNILMKLKKNV
jgi:hypothetical protein